MSTSANNNNNNNNPVVVAVGGVGNLEEDLRHQLRAALQGLKRREPLDPTYKRLLQSGVVTSRRPVLPKDKFYKRVGSQVRRRVETYLAQTAGKDPWDLIAQRKPLDNAAMRAALTLREAKEYEQQALLDATLAMTGAGDAVRKRQVDAIAASLQSRVVPSVAANNSKMLSMREQTMQAQQKAELDQQRNQARARETARKRAREQEAQQEQQQRNSKNNRQAETPQQALQKVISPILKKLWDMEFAHLGGTNPFRIVIDRENCASVGAPDYFDVIQKPMNLTYIRQKVEHLEYESLSAFSADVDLMLTNAVLYNCDLTNPYRVAAEDMKKRYMKMVKKVVQTLHNRQQGQRK